MLNKEDRDLLELAAKSIRLDVVQWVSNYGASDDEGLQFNHKGGGQGVWNPLADDGDALRLAVTLAFINPGCFPSAATEMEKMLRSGKTPDWHEATRRAIVKAAAALAAKEPQ